MAERELQRVDVGGERLTVTRLDDGYIAYELRGIVDGLPGIILSGIVHNPENDDRLGARRVLTALPTRFREPLDTSTRER